MLRHLNAPAMVTIVAVVLGCVATLTLPGVDATISAAVIIVLMLIAGAGVGLSVGSPGARHR